MRDAAEALKIVLFSMAAAIVYGILHDMVTAHLCVEYFTIFHPRLIPTESPVLLALFWGVFATWWVGLFLGAALALAARAGPAPKLCLRDLWRQIVLLMVVSALCALLAGVATAASLTDDYLSRTCAAVADAHLISYAAGGVGGLLLIGLTIWRRVRKPAA